MSRAYRIGVAESLRRHVQVEDGICSSLELLPVLAQERMAELLAARLLERGFTRRDGLAVRRDDDGVEVTVDLASAAVTARLGARAELELEAKRSGTFAESEARPSAEGKLRQQARESLEKEAASRQQSLREEVTARLEGKLRELRGELDGVVNRVTADALKARAAELGTIEELSEDPETGAMTIKVKL
jgi:hypothetical protein